MSLTHIAPNISSVAALSAITKKAKHDATYCTVIHCKRLTISLEGSEEDTQGKQRGSLLLFKSNFFFMIIVIYSYISIGG